MEVHEKDIPNVEKVVDYVAFFKNIYTKLLDDSSIQITNLEVLENHFALNFDKLRFKMDEDLFQYNHSMIVFIVLCMAYQREKVPPVTDDFLEQYELLPPTQPTLANDILNLHILHESWDKFHITELAKVQHYTRLLHKSVADKFIYANSLDVMNRWNMVKRVGKDLFLPTEKCMMTCASRCAENLKQFMIVRAVLQQYEPENKYEFSDYQINKFFEWAKQETTYFQIRNFRTRILNIFYLFIFDKPARDLYTYARAGEVPSVTAVVTAKFPSAWTSSMQHIILYAKPHELLGHEDQLIRNATMIALFEAYMKTIFSFNFSKYCVCMNFDIQHNARHIVLSEHPLVLFAWQKWYLVASGKLYYYDNLQETLLAWLFHLKDDSDCLIMKQISLLKICNTLCVDQTEPTAQDTSQQSFIEIDI